MNQKLKQLMDLLSYEDNQISEHVNLKKVDVDSLAKKWTFFLVFDEPVDIGRYKAFIDRLNTLPDHVASVNTVDHNTTFDSFGEEHVDDFFGYVLDELSQTNKRMSPLKNYGRDCSKDKVTMYVPKGSRIAALYRKDIERAMEKNGVPVDLKIEIDEQSDTIDKMIDDASSEFVHENLQSAGDGASITYEELYPDHPVEPSFTPIKDIPMDEIELAEFRARSGNKANFNVSGKIVSLDIRQFRNGAQANIILTDGEDSILIKKRVRDKDDQAFIDAVDEGYGMKVSGYARYDNYYGEVYINAIAMAKSSDVLPADTRKDTAKRRRVELHAHTKMSSLDGVTDASDYIDRAKRWGHKAFAVTDHGSVQSFPEMARKAHGGDFKPIYGLEMVYVDDEAITITQEPSDELLSNATYVVFDIETTGLSAVYDTIIEIGAVKIKNGATIDSFQTFINPEKPLPKFTTDLTGITENMVSDAPTLDKALPKFFAFSEGCILVAHNAPFDLGHLYHAYRECDITDQRQPSIDTLIFAKALYPNRRRFSLDALCKFLKVPLNNHHRAVNDAKATTEIFLHMLKKAKKDGIRRFSDLNLLLDQDQLHKFPYPQHINLLVKNQTGLKNVYKILSEGLTTYFDKDAKVLKSYLDQHRDGVLVGSGCRNSYFFETAMNKTREEMIEAAKYFDYLEVQPPSTFAHMRFDMPNWRSVIEDVIKRIVDVGKELNILVCATGDVHHLDPEDKKYREVMIASPMVGGGYHTLHREKEIPSQHFMTTDEMLEEFKFLGDETAENIVVDNPGVIADDIDQITIFPDELYAPSDDFLAEKGVPSIKSKVDSMVRTKAEKIYGNPLPALVAERLQKELDSIFENQFSTVYYISHLLVKKSLDDGYLVGSRGSVGSSLVATMMDITEVNPLPPHYVCPKCKFSAFKKTDKERRLHGTNEFEQKHLGMFGRMDSGWDLPDDHCPVCNTPMKKDGHDIPFETFLGFRGEKVPDIDLNFSGDYQATIHEYIRKLFGHNYAFRAGTIGTCAAKTAYAMVRDYYEKINEKRTAGDKDPLRVRRAEMERLSKGIEGVKRTSGQHPGGIVVVPNNKEIYDITPIQYPGDSKDTSWKTTHYDYHTFEENLFKLDVLGHDDPTMIRYLMDLVKQDPIDFPFSDPKNIPIDDPEVYKMLSGTEVIGLSPDDLGSPVASFGIPEFGTNFVRSMLNDSRPKTFAELVKISGLSHGTDVWTSNAQDLINGRKREFGRIDFKDIIGCRDDIMVDLIDHGMQPSIAFEIMEFVRKGKAERKPEKWGGYADMMRQAGVPEWYIWSCGKIKYMFPKAHATAYVLMAMRIAWFKRYKPIYFYAAYFSKRASYFDVDAMTNNEEGIVRKLNEISEEGNKASDRDKNLQTVLEVALEMVKRGFRFLPIDIHESAATEFLIGKDKKSLLLPLIVVDSLGKSVADSIVEARKEKPFISKQDVRERTRLSTTLFDRLEGLNAMEGMIEENQLSLFDL